MRTLCPECGPHVQIDEDGLCLGCGSTAIGDWVDRAPKADDLKHAIEQLEDSSAGGGKARANIRVSDFLRGLVDRAEGGHTVKAKDD